MSHLEAHSITQRIWDQTSIEQTLDALVRQLAAQAGIQETEVLITRSGPRTFTATPLPTGTAN
jgi:hypothetical protein